MQLPEGVDPSFLAALPENIRQEVLREHLGIRNTQTPPTSTPSGVGAATTTAAPVSASGSTPTTVTAGGGGGGSDPNSSISSEFLAALPPHIQEEVSIVM